MPLLPFELDQSSEVGGRHLQLDPVLRSPIDLAEQPTRRPHLLLDHLEPMPLMCEDHDLPVLVLLLKKAEQPESVASIEACHHIVEHEDPALLVEELDRRKEERDAEAVQVTFAQIFCRRIG